MVKSLSGFNISKKFLRSLNVEFIGFTRDSGLYWFKDLITKTGLVMGGADLTRSKLRRKVIASRKQFKAIQQ